VAEPASKDARVVDFPLRGEGWVPVNSPADRIPSHGVDMLGQRYAIDFVKVDQRGLPYDRPGGVIRAFTICGPTRAAYAWGAPIHAPFDAEVVAAVDGHPERRWLQAAREIGLALWQTLRFKPARLPLLLGNHVILRRGDVYAGLAHLAPGSVTVRPGQAVATGDVLGRVGHTGNSTAPHLHFQLMDSADPLTANGLPVAFEAYEVHRNGRWVPVANAVPGRKDRVRRLDA
jgi:Peptidase family M23